MPRPLENRTVAITEHRFENEFAALIARHGATVLSCPLLEERSIDNRTEIRAFIDRLSSGKLDMMVFFTGVGVRFLVAEAEAAGQMKRFVEALDKITVVARGPKPRAALRKLGRKVDLAPERPTSEGLLEMLGTEDLQRKRVGVQLYGKPNPGFCRGLEAMGAAVATVEVYDYRPASDRNRVLNFIQTLINGPVDVLTFTSAPQIDSLFDVADEAGLSAKLIDELNTGITVAVIGEVADRALARRGIRARIYPESPKMAPLAQAIADHYAGLPA